MITWYKQRMIYVSLFSLILGVILAHSGDHRNKTNNDIPSSSVETNANPFDGRTNVTQCLHAMYSNDILLLEGFNGTARNELYSCLGRCGNVGNKVRCYCDDVCWLYGDCCEDFYNECLSISINESDDAVLEATMSKYTNYSQVVRLKTVMKWLKLSSCVGADYYKVVMVTRCGRDEETMRNFSKLYDKINSPDFDGLSYFQGISMGEIQFSCEGEIDFPSIHARVVINHLHMKLIESGSKFLFFNVFCGICNGVDPLSMTPITSSIDCDYDKIYQHLLSGMSLHKIIEMYGCETIYTLKDYDDARMCMFAFDELYNLTQSQVDASTKSNFRDKESAKNESLPLCHRYFRPVVLGEKKSLSGFPIFWNNHCYTQRANSSIKYTPFFRCLEWRYISKSFLLLKTKYSFRLLFDFKERFLKVETKIEEQKDSVWNFQDELMSRKNVSLSCNGDTVQLGGKCYQQIDCHGNEASGSFCDFRPSMNYLSRQRFLSRKVLRREKFEIGLEFEYRKKLQDKDVLQDHQLPTSRAPFNDRYVFFLTDALNILKAGSSEEELHNFSVLALDFHKFLLGALRWELNKKTLKLTESVMCFDGELRRCYKISEITRKQSEIKVDPGNETEITNVCSRASNYNTLESKCENPEKVGKYVVRKHLCEPVKKGSGYFESTTGKSNLSFKNTSGPSQKKIKKLCLSFPVFYFKENADTFEYLEATFKNVSTALALRAYNAGFLLNKIMISNFIENFTFPATRNKTFSCKPNRTLETYVVQADKLPIYISDFYLDNRELPNGGKLLFNAEYQMFMNSVPVLKLQRFSLPLCVKPVTSDFCPQGIYIHLQWNEFFIFRNELILPHKDDNEDIEDEVAFLHSIFNNFTSNDSLGHIKLTLNNTFITISKSSYLLTVNGAFFCSRYLSRQMNVNSFDGSVLAPSSDVEYYCTILSSIVSIFSLLLVFLVYGFLPELRNNVPGKIVLSMSVSLLVAHILFFFSNVPTGLACEIFASFHHAAWMSSFVWLAFMSVHLAYTLYYKPIVTTDSNVFYSTSAVCWCFPILVAGVCFLLDKLDYVTIEYGKYNNCWIGNHKAAIIVFGIPVIVCLFLSVISLAVIISLIRKSVAFRHLSSSEYRGGSRHFLVCLNLTLLMALRIVCYFIALFTEVPELWIVYVLAHGCQGLFVFLCFVARKSIALKLVGKWARMKRN